MGRTLNPDVADHDPKPPREKRGPRSTQPRTVLISKALSRLLRHQATNEGVPITSDGWVRLDHVLAWKGLSSRGGVSPPPSVEEVWGVVEDDEKKRFAVRWIGKRKGDEKDREREGKAQPEVEGKGKGKGVKVASVRPGRSAREHRAVMEAAGDLLGEERRKDPPNDDALDDAKVDTPTAEAMTTKTDAQAEVSTAEQAESVTSQAISQYRNTQPPPPASEFQIRATQGHSIKTITEDALMTAITLDDPATVPDTCVHGTFYGAWRSILSDGGLRRMNRRHVHFATGPTLGEVGVNEQGEEVEGKRQEKEKAKVISGMRNDAQLLIYVDLKGALEEVKERRLEMTWWESENDVLLTEGVSRAAFGEDTAAAAAADQNTSDDAVNVNAPRDAPQQDAEPAQSSKPSILEAAQAGKNPILFRQKKQQDQGQRKNTQPTAQDDKIVPMRYWKVVVDVKGGHGVIWRKGEGVVKELPESLLSRGTPKRGRGRGGGGRGRGP